MAILAGVWYVYGVDYCSLKLFYPAHIYLSSMMTLHDAKYAYLTIPCTPQWIATKKRTCFSDVPYMYVESLGPLQHVQEIMVPNFKHSVV